MNNVDNNNNELDLTDMVFPEVERRLKELPNQNSRRLIQQAIKIDLSKFSNLENRQLADILIKLKNLDNIDFKIGNLLDLLYTAERPYNRGGKFEIYSLSCLSKSIKQSKNDDNNKLLTKLKKDLYNIIKLVFRKNNFFFANVLNYPKKVNEILQKKPPSKKTLNILFNPIFSKECYLIKEKQLIRFANKNETDFLNKKRLNNGSLEEQDGQKVMRRSYGRMIMANYRALIRSQNCGKNFEFFEINEMKEKIYYKIGDLLPNSFNKYNSLSIKDNNKTLKQIFELIQFYYYSDNSRSHIPALVKLPIGGRTASFLLYKTKSKNTLITFCNYGVNVPDSDPITTYFQSESYKKIITFPENVNKIKIAQDMIRCLDNPIISEVNKVGSNTFDYLSDYVYNKVIHLLALTQTVECYQNDDLNQARTPGLNKLARRIFRNIANGESTFASQFDYGRNSYLNNTNDVNMYENEKGYPCISNGIERAQKAVYTIDRVGALCHDMSDDSDNESNN